MCCILTYLTLPQKVTRLNYMKIGGVGRVGVLRNSEGQALVIVLLSLAVVITIILFVLSRSITDIAVSDTESQSVSAFSAAEAGVEQALVIGTGSSATIGDASYNASISNVASGVTSFVYPIEINSGDSMTLWLRSQDSSPSFTGNSIKVCWGKPGTSASSSTTPAIEVVLFYQTIAGNPATTRVYRMGYDPYTGRPVSNAFTSVGAGATIDGRVFPFCSTLDVTGLSNPQFAVIRMFYNTNTAHPIGFDTTTAATFPTQGINIDSSGTSGQSKRRVQVFQGWPEVPLAMLYGLYSPSGLSK